MYGTTTFYGNQETTIDWNAEVNDRYDLSHHSDPFGSLERSQIHGHVVQGDPNPREVHPGMSLVISTISDPL